MTQTWRRWAAFGLVATLVSQPLLARETARISIPAGRLDVSIMLLGRQADVSIGLADPAMGETRVRGLSGQMSADTALEQLLRGTGLSFKALDGRHYRIIRAPKPTPRRTVPQARSLGTLRGDIAPPPPPQEIVVTASKRDTALSDYPGSASVVTLDQRFGGGPEMHGTGAIVQELPVLNSTSLGPGRNKLFIRGVADSSFTGPTQATVGQYLGDARLNYNAPDPDLDLYDIGRVEVLEGPQGTLYGAGSLGGIVRLSPRLPESTETAGSLRVGASLTAHGASSRDAAAMVNIPVMRDKAALRLVAYNSVDGGYLRDSYRDLSNINRSRTLGGRAALRLQPGNDWTLDIGAVRQDIQNRDGQYSEDGLPDLTRASIIAQPSDNDYALGYVTVGKSWGRYSLRSTSSIIRHDLSNRFDASSLNGGGPLAFDQNIEIRQISNETRLSWRGPDGFGWVAGVSVNDGHDRVLTMLGNPTSPAPRSNVLNERAEIAAFGEWSLKISSSLSASLGGRFARTRFSGEIVDPDQPRAGEPSRTLKSFVPLASISWKPRPNWLIYARYQEGFRPGGLSVVGSDTAARFNSDTLSTFELGTRFGDANRDKFSASLVGSYARWESIQADLIDPQGFPYTDNIGNGRIWALSASMTWRPLAQVALEAAAFYNQSDLTAPAPGYERAKDNALPNIAEQGARVGMRFTRPLGRDARLLARANARYVGRSFLGVGERLDIPQGRYVDTSIDLRLEHGRMGLTLGMSNLFNADQNRFSYGNPFGVMSGGQKTPLRPRTVRLGLDAEF